MGTFVIRMNNLQSGGTPITDSTAVPADFVGWGVFQYPTFGILDAMNNTVFTDDPTLLVAKSVDGVFSKTLRFFPTGSSIYLDGSLTPIGINDLPAGFNPLSASVRIDSNIFVLNAHYYLQQGVGIEGTVDTDTFPYDFIIPPTMLSIFGNGIGFRYDDTAADGGMGNGCNLRIEGTYEIETFTFTLDPLPVAIGSGQQIVVLSPGPPEGIDLTELVTDNGNGTSGINLVYDSGFGPITLNIPPEDIILSDGFTLIIIFPNIVICPTGLRYDANLLLTQPILENCFLDPENIELTVEGNGTQFSGTLSLGLLSILIENASGIYRIIKNKTNDTFYTRVGYISFISKLLFAELLNDPIEEWTVINLNQFPYRIMDSEIIEDNDDDFIIMTSLEHRISQEVFGISNVFARTGYIGG